MDDSGYESNLYPETPSDSAAFVRQDQAISNSRQIFLEYEESLMNLYNYFTGRVKNEKTGEIKQYPDLVIMRDSPARYIINILKIKLLPAVRLGNLPPDRIIMLVHQTLLTTSKWICTDGMWTHGIDPAYFDTIMEHVEIVSLGGLTWSQNAIGQRFMTSSGRWVESISLGSKSGSVNPADIPVSQQARSGNPLKLFGK